VRRLGAPHRDPRSAALLVAVVACAVFANSFGNQYAYDDMPIVFANETIHSWEALPGAVLAPYWPNVYGKELGLWRPVTTGALGVGWILGGGSPLVFHALNVLCHVAASVLVLLLLMHLMSLPAALVAALVFAVHPIHVEAVANVVGFSEVASTAALLAACLIHVRSPERSGWGAALSIGLLYAIGFGAKESAVTLPGLVFLLDAARRRISFSDLGEYVRNRWRPYLAMGVVAAVLLYGRYAILDSLARPFAPLGASQLEDLPRIWTLGEIWTHYVRLWVFPLDLSADYSPDVIPVSLGWTPFNILGVALALGILVTTFVVWRRQEMGPSTVTSRAAAFGVVWFIIAISPVSNTVFLSGVLLAERTMYLPSVGLAAATGWLIVRLYRERPGVAWAALALALGLASARTWTRTPTWYNSPTVFATMIGDHPYAGRSQWVLGDEFLRVDSESSALRAYSAAIGILGQDYQLLTEISMKLIGLERYRLAEFLLVQAIQEDSSFPLAPALMSILRAEQADPIGTERYARMAIERTDDDLVQWHLLAWALASQGRWDEATEARERAEELGETGFWQRWIYVAYDRRRRGDEEGARAAADSAWEWVSTDVGRVALDSLRVAEFGLPSRLQDRMETEDPGRS
jgi:tetratricopeptide (TPR) repeat protein